MLQSINARQLSEWMAFEQLEPSGDERADARIGYAFAKLATVLTGRPQRPTDFIPSFEQKIQTPEEMKAIFKAGARAHNAHHR